MTKQRLIKLLYEKQQIYENQCAIMREAYKLGDKYTDHPSEYGQACYFNGRARQCASIILLLESGDVGRFVNKLR